jgi:hypothetical protein
MKSTSAGYLTLAQILAIAAGVMLVLVAAALLWGVYVVMHYNVRFP